MSRTVATIHDVAREVRSAGYSTTTVTESDSIRGHWITVGDSTKDAVVRVTVVDDEAASFEVNLMTRNGVGLGGAYVEGLPASVAATLVLKMLDAA